MLVALVGWFEVTKGPFWVEIPLLRTEVIPWLKTAV